ncbi:MAG TPA: sigma-70 family RNA polymerase sigma factor [Planctomycetota bacterium]|nr:sigma-70 family RNA polymerase sigma factor [Planctomycetota bacterium]
MFRETDVLGSQRQFPQTDWELLLPAKNLEPIDLLARRYWKPLYFFVRQRGFDIEASKDIVQSFLANVVAHGTFYKADRKLGRFRTFILTALGNFIKNWAKSASRIKRGGGVKPVSLGSSTTIAEYSSRFATSEDPPDRAINRVWARSLLDQALADMKGAPLHLTAFQLYRDGASYEDIAAKTGLSPVASKVAVHRLRGQLRRILTARISETVGADADLDAELSEFVGLLS